MTPPPPPPTLGTANLDPRGMVGTIYVEYHQTSLHT